MNAAVLHAPGDLRVEKIPIPQISSGSVLVKVKNCGICGSDLPRILHHGTYRFPTVPGHEFAGEIAEVAAGETQWNVGDRVVAAPLLPCGNCGCCTNAIYGQCQNYDFIGSRRDGAFSEYVTVPSQNLLPLHTTISFEEGAMVEPAAVTLHGLLKLGLTSDHTVAVLGAGCIGIMSIALARILGVKKIIAADIAKEKLEMAKLYGADICVLSTEEDPVKAVMRETGGTGADAVIEAAGAAATQEQSLCMAAPQGTILFLGTAHRPVTFQPEVFERILRKELTIIGSWNSYSQDFPGKEWRMILNYLQEQKLHLKPMITKVIDLDLLPKTLQAMESRQLEYLKVLTRL